MRYAKIVSTGRYVPEIEVSNDTLRKRFAHLPDFVDKMEEASNILTRWYAPESWATSDVAQLSGAYQRVRMLLDSSILSTKSGRCANLFRRVSFETSISGTYRPVETILAYRTALPTSRRRARRRPTASSRG